MLVFVRPNPIVKLHHCSELSFIVFRGVVFHFSPRNILNYEKHVFIEFQITSFLFCQLLDTPAVLKDSNVVHIDNQQTVINPSSLSYQLLPTLIEAIQWPMLIHYYFVDFFSCDQLLIFECFFN